jgi:hypothetical protein
MRQDEHRVASGRGIGSRFREQGVFQISIRAERDIINPATVPVGQAGFDFDRARRDGVSPHGGNSQGAGLRRRRGRGEPELTRGPVVAGGQGDDSE